MTWPLSAMRDVYWEERSKMMQSSIVSGNTIPNGIGSTSILSKVRLHIVVCHCRESLDWMAGADP